MSDTHGVHVTLETPGGPWGSKRNRTIFPDNLTSSLHTDSDPVTGTSSLPCEGGERDEGFRREGRPTRTVTVPRRRRRRLDQSPTPDRGVPSSSRTVTVPSIDLRSTGHQRDTSLTIQGLGGRELSSRGRDRNRVLSPGPKRNVSTLYRCR